MSRAGKYRDRIALLKDISSNREDNPRFSLDHPVARDIPALVNHVDGYEKFRGTQLTQYDKFAIEIRHREELKSDFQIYVESGLFAGRTLKINRSKVIRKRSTPPEIIIFCSAVNS